MLRSVEDPLKQLLLLGDDGSGNKKKKNNSISSSGSDGDDNFDALLEAITAEGAAAKKISKDGLGSVSEEGQQTSSIITNDDVVVVVEKKTDKSSSSSSSSSSLHLPNSRITTIPTTKTASGNNSNNTVVRARRALPRVEDSDDDDLDAALGFRSNAAVAKKKGASLKQLGGNQKGVNKTQLEQNQPHSSSTAGLPSSSGSKDSSSPVFAEQKVGSRVDTTTESVVLAQLRIENVRLKEELESGERRKTLELESMGSSWERKMKTVTTEWTLEKDRLDIRIRQLDEQLKAAKSNAEEEKRLLRSSLEEQRKMVDVDRDRIMQESRQSVQHIMDSKDTAMAVKLQSIQIEHENILRHVNEKHDEQVRVLRVQLHDQSTVALLAEKVCLSTRHVEEWNAKMLGDRKVEEQQRLKEIVAQQEKLEGWHRRLKRRETELEQQELDLKSAEESIERGKEDSLFASQREEERLAREQRRVDEIQSSIREEERKLKEKVSSMDRMVANERHEIELQRRKKLQELERARDELEQEKRSLRTWSDTVSNQQRQAEETILKAERRVRETEAVVAKERTRLAEEIKDAERHKETLLVQSESFATERESIIEEKNLLNSWKSKLSTLALQVQQKSQEVSNQFIEAKTTAREAYDVSATLKQQEAHQAVQLATLRAMQVETAREEARKRLLSATEQQDSSRYNNFHMSNGPMHHIEAALASTSLPTSSNHEYTTRHQQRVNPSGTTDCATSFKLRSHIERHMKNWDAETRRTTALLSKLGATSSSRRSSKQDDDPTETRSALRKLSSVTSNSSL